MMGEQFMLTASVGVPLETVSGNFNARVSFNARVVGFGKGNVSISSSGGNGATGVDFEILGVGSSYNLDFTLPEETSGGFHISLSGILSVPDEQMHLEIMSDGGDVVYDDITSVIASFLEPVYQDDGEICVPIRFEEPIIYFSKTDCEVRHVDGDAIFDFEYFLIGGGTEYEIVIIPTPGRLGLLSVDIIQHVWKSTSIIREDVITHAKLVPFNSRKPYVVDYQYINGRELTPGMWDVFMELDIPAIGIGIGDFVYVGENPSTPTLYLASSFDIKPLLPPPPIDGSNPPECVGEWTSDSTGNSVKPAKYLLLRFNVPPGVGGEFSLDLIPGSIRGAI